MKNSKRYWALLISVLMVFALVVSGCGGSGKTANNDKPAGEPAAESKAPASGGKTRQISIGTASTGGSFYPIGVGVAKVLTDYVPGMNATAEQTGGAVENVNLLNKGEIDIGFVPSVTAKSALNGTAPFKEKQKMVVAWQLFNTPIHFVSMTKSGIKTINDLKGKKVSLGTAGSSGNSIGKMILAAHGITEKDFTPVYQGWDESADALGDGQIDAILVMSAVPSGSIQGLAATKDVTLVDVDKKIFEDKMKDSGASPLLLKAGTYKGQKNDVTLVDTGAHAWVSPDMPEDEVYNIVKAVMEHKDYLKTVHPQAAGFAVMTKAKADKLGVTVHPGAIKYAKEIGEWDK